MLKRLSYLLLLIAISYLVAFGTLQILDAYLNHKTGDDYFDGIGNEASLAKSANLELQKRSMLRKDNLTIYGSCELEDRYDKFNDNVSVAFSNKNSGFQVNKIGVSGFRSILHAMNLGSLDRDLRDKKIIFIASESWFKEQSRELGYGFSSVKFFSFMFNPKLSTFLKKRLAKRVILMPKNQTTDLGLESFYAAVYLSEYSGLNILQKIVHPFYYLYYRLLVTQDKYAASQKLDEFRAKKMPEIVSSVIGKHDWETEKLSSVEKEKPISNNEFCVRDERLADFPSDIEEYLFKISPDSPEHEDFLIFLEVCKELNVRPLIVYWPVHGKVFDHYVKMFRLNNGRKKLEKLHGWIRDTVKSYGFTLADFSEYEYVCYFNSGYTQPGSLGMSYLNEAISKFYNQNR